MISSIYNASQAYSAQQISNAAVVKQASTSTKQSEPAQDTVHLSPQALAASKDADHDGDSH